MINFPVYTIILTQSLLCIFIETEGRDGGIGIRRGLKIPGTNVRAGSSPAPGKIKSPEVYPGAINPKEALPISVTLCRLLSAQISHRR